MMNEFFKLNEIYVVKTFKPFEPVSMFFRTADWTTREMTEILLTVASRAIDHVFA
jgi:hypothetical protein